MTNDNDFKLTMPIEKSYEHTDAEGNIHRYVAGLASGIGLDHDGERMATTAIEAFKRAIEEGVVLPNGKWSQIPLRSGHRKEWDDVLGWVTKATIDDEYNLWIEAELEDTSLAKDLFVKLHRGDRVGRPLQLGFSIGGKIKKASREWDAEYRKSIRVIEDIQLKEISVVGSPAYPPSYVEALTKSVDWDKVPIPQEELSYISKEKLMTLADKTEETVVKDATVEGVAPTNETNFVETTAEVAEVETEEVTSTSNNVTEAVADPNTFEAQLNQLQQTVDSLVQTVQQLSQPQAVVEQTNQSDKSQKVEDTDIEKMMNDRIVTAVTAAFEAFKNEAMSPLLSEMQAVKASLEELSEQSVDKSYSVRTSREGGENLVEKFHNNVSSAIADKKPVNIIGESVRLALAR